MKPIVLFFDGTWNSETHSEDYTNIHKMKEAVIEATAAVVPSGMGAPRLFYDPGVGTLGPIDKYLGGIFGFGLSENVRQGYRYLSQHYDPGRGEGESGDPLFVFGFSRGAFTARSLAGFVAASGLLRPEHCNAKNLDFAWRYYRTEPKKRMPADRAALEALCHPNVTIRLLGVFDTVGSLGIPTGEFGNWAGTLDQFHDTKIGSAIDVALHAVALDEHRGPFVPALFARPDNLKPRPVEQVWFPGVHSDVGGGYRRRDTGRTSIADVALTWMIERVRRLAPELPLNATTPIVADIDDPHDSLKGFVVSERMPIYRLIDGRDMPRPPPFPHGAYRLKPPDVSWREQIHVAVFDLIIQTHLDAKRTDYLPPQIFAIAEDLRQGRFDVVDYAGAVLSFAEVVDLLDRTEKAIDAQLLR